MALGGLLYFFFFNSRGIAIRSGFRRSAAQTAPAAPPPAQAQPPAQVPVPAEPAARIPEPAAQIPAPAEPEEGIAAVPEQPAAMPPVISADLQPPRAAVSGEDRANRTRLPPVASYKVPQTIPRGGAPYTIRWGDTLWDISEAFYRNPWLYPRIARFNSIRNPDFIVSGRTIRIPPGN